jgi:hypothetical protein
VLVGTAAFALFFAALDVRAIRYQVSETLIGLAMMALLAAVLHGGAAGVAGMALTRREAHASSGSPS